MKTFPILLLLLVGACQAFPIGAAQKKGAVKQAGNAAIAVFEQKFPFDDGAPIQQVGLGNFGMPGSSTSAPGKRLTDIGEPRARAAFAELAKLYGTDEALEMVQVQPIVLCFNYKLWKESLENWGEVYGLEKAQGMVQRNPGLLAVKPADAAASDESTMVFSYIVGITRPFSKVLLPLLLLLVLSPGIEQATGIPIREMRESLFN
eukprot:CAMPEP_0119005874 /NCGR_PEP_ID=MMETSP1176-20130426/1979_1 /TAXON_ID=265551 /ORGANISM="Synedropsis recta cf, Strain CCMP1620" /LENGTH=204 /DNA_ID=CAMNT_0006957729 /DNA_START=53 /DNA_END=667 /DNA_ORIENTATION=+